MFTFRIAVKFLFTKHSYMCRCIVIVDTSVNIYIYIYTRTHANKNIVVLTCLLNVQISLAVYGGPRTVGVWMTTVFSHNSKEVPILKSLCLLYRLPLLLSFYFSVKVTSDILEGPALWEFYVIFISHRNHKEALVRNDLG